MPMKLFMMPQTVPNSPMNGAVAPTLAMRPMPPRIDRPAALSISASREATRSLIPLLSRAGSPERANSDRAAYKKASVRRLRSPSRLSASSSVRCSPISHAACRRLRMPSHSSALFASHTVQTATDASARPTMTAFTTISAAMNIPHGERSRGRWALSMDTGRGSLDAG